ncbi:MAG TPA: hypothetical protein VGL26_05515 [Jatrophihabitans sp.]|jgi:hypothetical protein
MTEDEIEQALRETFAAKAATITRGPVLPAENDTPHSSTHWRWLAPLLAAAAIVTLVVGLAVGFNRNGHSAPATPPSTPSSTSTSDPIPAGMKAVDALGVEIYVPSDAQLDPYCSIGGTVVYRPVPPPMPAPSCPTSNAASVAVSIQPPTESASAGGAGPASPGSEPTCVSHVVLSAERECVFEKHDASTGLTTYEVGSGADNVYLTASANSSAGAQRALQIIESTHEVSVDRYGCSATDPSPSILTTQTITPLNPDQVESLDVCWYRSNRLVASGEAQGAKAQSVAHAVNALPPKWPALQPDATLPTCDQVATTDGVLLTFHPTNGNTVTGPAQLAACDGQRTEAVGGTGRLMEPSLAPILREATGIPFQDAYDSRWPQDG